MRTSVVERGTSIRAGDRVATRGRRLSAATRSSRRSGERRQKCFVGIRLAIADSPLDQLADLALVPDLVLAHPIDVPVEVNEEPIRSLVGGRLELRTLHLVDLEDARRERHLGRRALGQELRRRQGQARRDQYQSAPIHAITPAVCLGSSPGDVWYSGRPRSNNPAQGRRETGPESQIRGRVSRANFSYIAVMSSRSRTRDSRITWLTPSSASSWIS